MESASVNERGRARTDPTRVHGPDLEPARVEAQDLALEVVGGGERLVAEVGLVLERKGELAVGELAGRGCGRGCRGSACAGSRGAQRRRGRTVGLVEPEEHGLPGEEAAVVGAHDHGVTEVAHALLCGVVELGEHCGEVVVLEEVVESCCAGAQRVSEMSEPGRREWSEEEGERAGRTRACEGGCRRWRRGVEVHVDHGGLV